MICKSGHLILCIALSIIVARCMADTDKDEVTEKSSGAQYKYCGRNLVNVLTLICDGSYNRPKDGSNSKIKLPTDLDLIRFRSKRSVVDVFQRNTGRFRRGAYDDCCRKGCTIEAIFGYCGV